MARIGANLGSLGLAVAVGVAAAFGTPRGVSAQAIDLGYQTQTWSSYSEELRRLHGVVVRARWRDRVEASVDVGASTWSEQGSTCVGFIPEPSDCVIETLDALALSFGASLGYVLMSDPGEIGAVGVVPSVGVAMVRLHREGRDTGGSTSDSHVVAEAGLGLRYVSPPITASGMHLSSEYRVAWGNGLETSCEDCGNTLRGDSRRHMLSLTISLPR